MMIMKNGKEVNKLQDQLFINRNQVLILKKMMICMGQLNQLI